MGKCTAGAMSGVSRVWSWDGGFDEFGVGGVCVRVESDRNCGWVGGARHMKQLGETYGKR